MKNKEIEELLNKAKDIAKYGADGKQHTRMFNQFEAKALLSYIEQLEKEIENYKTRIKTQKRRRKEATHKKNIYKEKLEQLENKNKENSLLLIEFQDMEQRIKQLENNRNEVAKEIIYMIDNCDISYYQGKKLENILMGDSDE